MPMGPITLHDVIGLDTALFAGRVLAAAYPDRMFEPKILPPLVEAGRLGQKSGAGFYRYDSDTRKGTLDPLLEAMIAKLGSKPKRAFTEEEITNRLFLAMLVEAIHVLSETIVGEPETIDTSLILGTGFPTARRGLLRWADTLGAKKIVAALEAYESLGLRFKAPQMLIQLARAPAKASMLISCETPPPISFTRFVCALSIFLQLLHKARLLNLIEQAEIPEVLFRNPLGLGLIQGYEIEHGADRFGIGTQIFGDASRDILVEKSIHFRIRILKILCRRSSGFPPDCES